MRARSHAPCGPAAVAGWAGRVCADATTAGCRASAAAVPEDRFGDLGEPRPPEPETETETKRAGTRAGDRFADLDRTHPEEPRARQPRRLEPGRSYMWVVGVAGVIAIAVVAINSLPNAGRGSSGPIAGKPMPKFAARRVRPGRSTETRTSSRAATTGAPPTRPPRATFARPARCGRATTPRSRSWSPSSCRGRRIARRTWTGSRS